MTQDILDSDLFWQDLLRANDDLLMTCDIYGTGKEREDGTLIHSGCSRSFLIVGAAYAGLSLDHAYTIMKGFDYKNKRFVKVRKPSAASSWRGPWSDGSKEWTKEWLEAVDRAKEIVNALSQIRHNQGDEALTPGVPSHANTFDDQEDYQSSLSNQGHRGILQKQLTNPGDTESLKGRKRFSKRQSKSGLTAVF